MAPDSSRGELREGICSFSPNEEQIAVPSPGSGLMVPSQRAPRVTGEEQTESGATEGSQRWDWSWKGQTSVPAFPEG